MGVNKERKKHVCVAISYLQFFLKKTLHKDRLEKIQQSVHVK